MGEWEEGSHWHGWAGSGWRGPVAEDYLSCAEHLGIAVLGPALPALVCSHCSALVVTEEHCCQWGPAACIQQCEKMLGVNWWTMGQTPSNTF